MCPPATIERTQNQELIFLKPDILYATLYFRFEHFISRDT